MPCPSRNRKNREVYRERRNRGLCYNCSKKPLKGHAYCNDCAIKDRISKISRRIGKIERYLYNLDIYIMKGGKESEVKI